MSPAVGQIDGKGFGATVKRTAVSAAIGGTASKLSGGSFANGAQTGAFQQLFNETVHQEHGAWPQDEAYDPTDPSYHNYTEINAICTVDMPGCTLRAVNELILTSYNAPSFQLKPQPVAKLGKERLLYGSPTPGLGISDSYIVRGGVITQQPLSYGVLNRTTHKHPLYPGVVVRVAFKHNGTIYAVTHGVGTNFAGSITGYTAASSLINSIAGGRMFRDQDSALKQAWAVKNGH